MKKFIITESEKNDIRKMYGLIKEQVETPVCNDDGCSGKYIGPNFDLNGDDVAHQYSNVITKEVAKKLKELYTQGKYVKVNFDGIKLFTKGLKKSGTSNVEYEVEIPFTSVQNKCEARTGFGHVGGWGHEGAGVSKRKSEIYNDAKTDPTTKKPIFDQKGNQIRTNPVVGTINDMESSNRTYTPEGLVEYWIQWKHSNYQSDCEKTNNQEKAQTQSTNGQTTNNEQVSIKGSSLDDLRTKVKSQTQGLSIDTESANLDVNNLTVTFKKGDEPIHNLSVIWSDVSRDELNLVYQKVSKSNKVEFLGDVKELNSGGTTIYCLLIVIY